MFLLLIIDKIRSSLQVFFFLRLAANLGKRNRMMVVINDVHFVHFTNCLKF